MRNIRIVHCSRCSSGGFDSFGRICRECKGRRHTAMTFDDDKRSRGLAQRINQRLGKNGPLLLEKRSRRSNGGRGIFDLPEERGKREQA